MKAWMRWAEGGGAETSAVCCNCSESVASSAGAPIWLELLEAGGEGCIFLLLPLTAALVAPLLETDAAVAPEAEEEA